MSQIKNLSIIIPVFNEINTIDKLIKQVVSVNLPGKIGKEIIIVDDASSDGTRAILRKLSYKKI